MSKMKELTIDLNNVCKLSCLHCSNPMEQHAPELSIDKVIAVIREFSILGGEQINLAGGEPLIYNGVDKVISESNELNLFTTIYTSGIWWSKQNNTGNLHEKVFQLTNAGLKSTYLSLHGATKETHDNFTQREGSFDNLISFGKLLRKSGINVLFHYVPMKTNEQEIDQAFRLTMENKFKGIRFLRFVPQGRGKRNTNNLLIDGKPFRLLVEKLKRLKSKYSELSVTFGGFPEYFPCRTYDKYGQGCQAGKLFLHITSDGYVVPCPAYKQHPKSILSELENSCLRTALNSTRLKEVLNEYVNTNDSIWVCPAHR